MEHAFTAWVAWISLAATVSAGYCGLRMCRAMLRQVTPGNLQLEADTKTLLLASFSSLNTSHRAQVLRVLSESEPIPASWTHQAHSVGSRSIPLSIKKQNLTHFGSSVVAAVSASFSQGTP